MGAIALAVIVTGFLLLRQPLGFAQSDRPLLGDVVESGAAGHVEDGALGAPATLPPAGGPHYTTPAQTGVFESPLDDGYLIHALEHGIVWLAYSPALVDAEGVETLRTLATEYSRDVILSPRPANDVALYAVSWGRRLQATPSDLDLLRTFIETNRNRSPEPGIR